MQYILLAHELGHLHGLKMQLDFFSKDCEFNHGKLVFPLIGEFFAEYIAGQYTGIVMNRENDTVLLLKEVTRLIKDINNENQDITVDKINTYIQKLLYQFGGALGIVYALEYYGDKSYQALFFMIDKTNVKWGMWIVAACRFCPCRAHNMCHNLPGSFAA